MELTETIKIAQSHLNGEETSLDDVIKSYKDFIEANTSLYKKSWCKYPMTVGDVWELAESSQLMITDEEAADFIETLSFTDGTFNAVESGIEYSFESRFKNASKGSIIAKAILDNDIEKIRAFTQFYANRLGSYDFDFYDSYSFEDKDRTFLEMAVDLERKEIIEIILRSVVTVTEETINRTSNSEIKAVLRKAFKS